MAIERAQHMCHRNVLSPLSAITVTQFFPQDPSQENQEHI